MKVIGKGSFVKMSENDRDIIDEIIFALDTLEEDKLISYNREINWLKELKKL